MKLFISTALVLYLILPTYASEEYTVELQKPVKAYDSNIVKIEMETHSNDIVLNMVDEFQEFQSTAESFHTGSVGTPTETNRTPTPPAPKTLAKIWVEDKIEQIKASQNGEQNLQNNETEKFVTRAGVARMFPLFTTFNYEEPASQLEQILYPLTEENAIYLYMISEMFKDTVVVNTNKTPTKNGVKVVKEDIDAEYCQLTYPPEKVDACVVIRTSSYVIFDKVHRKHMDLIMDWVERKQGVAPQDYVVKLRDDGSIQIQKEEDYDPDNPIPNWDNQYVNRIWNSDRKDVGYVMNAANSINIPAMCKLMGAKIGHEINKSIANDESVTPPGRTFEELANQRLDNEFLRQ